MIAYDSVSSPYIGHPAVLASPPQWQANVRRRHTDTRRVRAGPAARW